MTKTTKNGRKRRQRLFCWLLTAALFCSLSPLPRLLADPTDIIITDENDQKAFDQGMKQLEEYSKKTEQIKKEQDEKTAQQKGLNGQIKQKQGQVVDLEEEISVLDGEIQVAEKAIQTLEVEITEKTGQVDQRTDYLYQRLVQVYVDGELERKSVQLGSDLKELAAAEDELNELSQQIMKMVAEIQAKHSSVYLGKGTMGWPVASYTRISSYYGYRLHPILKVQRFHSGIDIAAPKETPALASETGKVIVATNMGLWPRARRWAA